MNDSFVLKLPWDPLIIFVEGAVYFCGSRILATNLEHFQDNLTFYAIKLIYSKQD